MNRIDSLAQVDGCGDLNLAPRSTATLALAENTKARVAVDRDLSKQQVGLLQLSYRSHVLVVQQSTGAGLPNRMGAELWRK